MIKAMECLGEIMNDGHINIPEDEKQFLNWKTGRKIRLIIYCSKCQLDIIISTSYVL